MLEKSKLDKAVLDFKQALTKKSLVIGVDRSRILDFINDDKIREEKRLLGSWSLKSKVLR